MNLRRTVFLILLIIAITGGAWGAYYARERGFTQSWRALIETEISKQGYYVDIGRLTLGPFQGLVAQDVRFYQEDKRKTVIAYIDKVILDIDLSQVMDKKVSINTIDFKDADLSLPIDPKDIDSERLQIRRCSARILMPADKIEIVKAEAQIHGILVSLKGTLLKPTVESPESQSSKGDRAASKDTQKKKRAEQIQMISERRQLFHQILSELDAIDFPKDQPPRIELDVQGSLDQVDSLLITARLSADNLSHKNYSTRQINALVESDGSSVKLRQFHLQDDKGDLRLRGEWLRSEKYVDFELNSSIDIQSLAQSIYPSPSIGEVVFFSSPQIAIEGRWFFDRPLELTQLPQLPRLPLNAIGSFHCEKLVAAARCLTVWKQISAWLMENIICATFDSTIRAEWRLPTAFTMLPMKTSALKPRLNSTSQLSVLSCLKRIPGNSCVAGNSITNPLSTLASPEEALTSSQLTGI